MILLIPTLDNLQWNATVNTPNNCQLFKKNRIRYGSQFNIKYADESSISYIK